MVTQCFLFFSLCYWFIMKLFHTQRRKVTSGSLYYIDALPVAFRPLDWIVVYVLETGDCYSRLVCKSRLRTARPLSDLKIFYNIAGPMYTVYITPVCIRYE